MTGDSQSDRSPPVDETGRRPVPYPPPGGLSSLCFFLSFGGWYAGRVQKVLRVKLTIEQYVREQFHKRMRPPSQCPNCWRFHGLWGHAYYERGGTDTLGKLIMFRVRRFICRYCEITVSCLPFFAQPYRLVNHLTLEAFLEQRYGRRDVQRCWELLKRYRRRFELWQPELIRIIGHRFGRAPPEEDATAFWRRAVATCGSAAELTMELVTEFRTTCFRTYRCHQRSPAR